jgi:hypothetical protein
MILVFIAMLPSFLPLVAFVLITSLFLTKDFIRGDELPRALLFAFLVPGLGLTYLGSSFEGRAWYCGQFLAICSVSIVENFVSPESPVPGAIMVVPWAVQLWITAEEYIRQYGEVGSWWEGR